MGRPLYRLLYRLPDDQQLRQQQGHAGLWFDKFCDQWQPEWKMEAPDKLRWIERTAGQVVGIRDHIRESAWRLMRLTRMLDGRAEVYATESRFVTGLGRSHPVENGFAWHPTLGTPFLPGSSVKGMVGAWAKAEQKGQKDRERILGSQGQVGSVRFLDALPMGPVSLEPDVMTPHYAGWSLQDPPGDWRSPKPIPFLTTAPGTRFVFGIVPTSATRDGDLDTVSDWLGKALKWAGAGAKTAVGYGRMKRDEQGEHELARDFEEQEARAREQEARAREQMAWEAQLAAMHPVVREIHQKLDNRQDKGMSEVVAVFQWIRGDHWQGDDKMVAAKWLRDKMQSANQWKEVSTKKRPEKDWNHQRTLVVMEWLK